MEDSFWKIWSDMVCLSRWYQFKVYKSCLPQILLGPFLNTLTHLISILWTYVHYKIITETYWLNLSSTYYRKKTAPVYYDTLLLIFFLFFNEIYAKQFASCIHVSRWKRTFWMKTFYSEAIHKDLRTYRGEGGQSKADSCGQRGGGSTKCALIKKEDFHFLLLFPNTFCPI